MCLFLLDVFHNILLDFNVASLGQARFDYEGLWNLTCPIVWLWNDSTIHHCRVAQETSFKLGGRNLKTLVEFNELLTSLGEIDLP